MKIAVVNLKNIIKYIFIFFALIFITIILINMTQKEKIKNNKKSLIGILRFQLPITNSFKKNDEGLNRENFGLKILSMQVGLFGNINLSKNEELNDDNIYENTIEDDEIINNEIEYEITQDIEENIDVNIEDDSKTNVIQVINEHNINPTFTNEFKGIRINNQTSYDILDVLKNSSFILKSKKAIIYHTHTCESYTPTENFNYTMTDSYRTTDFNYNVVRVGNELENELKKYGFEIIHNNTYHDYPSYNGSYGRSLKTLENMLLNNPNTQIAIDLHRDAIGSDSNYAPRVKINDEICARIRTQSPKMERKLTICN